MMVYNRDKEKGEVIDFREAAPKGAHPHLFHGDATKGIRGELISPCVCLPADCISITRKCAFSFVINQQRIRF